MRFHIAQTLIRIHPLLLLLIFLTFLVGNELSLYASLCALLIHESGHILCCILFHIPIRQIELGLLGGTMDCTMQSSPRLVQILISLSGPLFNLLGYVLSYTMLSSGISPAVFWLDFLRMNLLLFLFNLLPILPLDGGQIILALCNHAPLCKKVLTFTATIAGVSLILLSVMFAFHLRLNLSPALAGCFLLYSASVCKRTAAAQCMHQIILQENQMRRTKLIPVRIYHVNGEMPLIQLAQRLPAGHIAHMRICDPDTGNILGEMTHRQLCTALLENADRTAMDVIASVPSCETDHCKE